MKEIFRKILIIGSPGSGKSTLARKLHRITNIPIIYLDMIWHKKDGSHISQEEFDQKLGILLQKEAWIMDGNYSRTLDRRIQQADLIFWLHYPCDLCHASIRSRIGLQREDLPWLETELDPEFEIYVRDFEAEKVPRLKALLQNAISLSIPVLEFHSREQTDEFLKTLPVSSFEALVIPEETLRIYGSK